MLLQFIVEHQVEFLDSTNYYSASWPWCGTLKKIINDKQQMLMVFSVIEWK